jgi:hypothetical protein
VGVTIQINLIEMTSPSAALVLNIAASVAGIFRERTYGLLGTYDGQAINDLRAQDGQIVNNTATLEQIHQQFGITWAIDPTTSLFYYESDQSAAFFQEQNELFLPIFVEPINSPDDDARIRDACKINSTSVSSSWNIAQQTCYYDISVTNDETFGQTSFNAADEISSIKADQLNPPLFNISLPVFMQVKDGDRIHLKMDASSEYPSSVINLSPVHLPQGATFNTEAGIFNWTAVAGEDYVRIQALDTTYNLMSTHEIVFRVESVTKNGANQFELQILLFLVNGLFVLLLK